MKPILAWVGWIGATFLVTGCAVVPSTAKRAVVTGIGAAAGGGAGYALGDKRPGWTVAGAGAGALLAGMALGKDPAVQQESFDEGYVQGQADAIKRQYFLRQSMEQHPFDGAAADEGTQVHYVVPGPTVTSDGRQLEPHTVTLTVTE